MINQKILGDRQELDQGKLFSNADGADCFVNTKFVSYADTIRKNKVASSEKYTIKEVEPMNNDKLLEMYIEKMNQDQAELRQDIRESENRISASLDRIDKSFDQLNEKINKLEESTSLKLEKLEESTVKGIEKLEVSTATKVDKLHENTETKLNQMTSEMHSFKWQMWAMVITVILSMGALVAAFFFGFPTWLQLVLAP